MTQRNPPTPKFARFERVVVRCRQEQVALEARARHRYEGLEGVVFWQEPYYTTSRGPVREWLYVVYVPGLRQYPTLAEGDLVSLGQIDTPDAHVGRGHEFSFDTVIEDRDDDRRVIEGCFRAPGAHWRVMLFLKEEGVATSSWASAVWPSGIGGLEFRVAEAERLNRAYVRHALALAVGVGDWTEAPGPDSLALK
jgi:hypothetical protein